MELSSLRRDTGRVAGSGSRALAACLVACCLAVLPFARADLGRESAVLAALATAIVLCDALVAALLLARFVARGSALPLLLGCTFLASAIVAAARALVLPGLGADGGAVLAGGHAVDWLWGAAHAGVPLGIAAAVWGGPPALRRRLAAPTLRRTTAVVVAAATTTGLVVALTGAVVLARHALPAATSRAGATAVGAAGAAVVLAAHLGALVLAIRRARRSTLERRLALVTGCLLVGAALAIAADARYTAGWYASAALELAATGVLLLTLLVDPAHLGRGGAADRLAGGLDPLTGAASRAAALVTAEHLHRTRAPGAPLSLVLVDIDALRAIQDEHGPLASDAVVLTVAQRVRALLRDEDLLARAGDEGFLILLPGTDVEGAALVADRAIAAIRSAPVGTWAHDVRTTASGGVARVPEGDDAVARALAAADLALNQAKANGRDQVVSPGRAVVVPLRRAGAAPPPS